MRWDSRTSNKVGIILLLFVFIFWSFWYQNSTLSPGIPDELEENEQFNYQGATACEGEEEEQATAMVTDTQVFPLSCSVGRYIANMRIPCIEECNSLAAELVEQLKEEARIDCQFQLQAMNNIPWQCPVCESCGERLKEVQVCEENTEARIVRKKFFISQSETGEENMACEVFVRVRYDGSLIWECTGENTCEGQTGEDDPEEEP